MSRISSILAAAATLSTPFYAAPDAASAAAGTPGESTPVKVDFTAATESVAEAVAKNNLPILTDKNVIKAIHDAIGGQRIILKSLNEAAGLLGKAMESTNSFVGLPVKIADETLFTEKTEVCIATLGTRVKQTINGKEVGVNAIRAVMVFPIPTVEEFISTQRAFVDKLVIREAADTIFGRFRAAATITELDSELKGIPTDTASIATTSRAESDKSAFDTYWKDWKEQFIAENANFKTFLAIPKAEIEKAFRSASYATANPNTVKLEERGLWAKILILFTRTLAGGIQNAEGENEQIDVSTLESWLANRNEVNLAYSSAATASADDLSLAL